MPMLALCLFLTTLSCNTQTDEQLIAIENPTKKDLDKLLDRYESYSNDYLKIMKKVKSGKISDVSEKELNSISEKAEAIGNKLNKCDENFTIEQEKRFNKIEERLLKSISDENDNIDVEDKDEDESINILDIDNDNDELTEDISINDGNKNWDKLLNDYESFINKYLVLLKKANKGDVSAVQEYTSLFEKAEILGDDFDKNADNLTPKQLKKYIDLQAKISKAAVDLMQ